MAKRSERNALKPCPFCGREAIVHQIPEDDRIRRELWNVWIVGCDGEPVCPGYAWNASQIYSTKENAVEHWNRRAEQTAKAIEHDASITTEEGYKFQRSEYLCEACHKKVIGGDEYCSHCGKKLDWSGL